MCRDNISIFGCLDLSAKDTIAYLSCALKLQQLKLATQLYFAGSKIPATKIFHSDKINFERKKFTVILLELITWGRPFH